jgi:mannose/cellobiose epimerase-like protein (N-acyl-D-glucosamine 2-epimerase family)
MWICCRMTHVYALGQLLGRPDCSSLVDHGIAALTGLFRDQTHGGWYSKVAGISPTTTSKNAYDHAFVVLAAASATAAGRPGGEALLDEALGVFLGRFWDDGPGMFTETWDESWSTVDGYRGVNANMHAVEALLAAGDVLGDTSLRDRALQVTARVVRDLAPAHEWRIPEHFDSDWSPLLEYNADAPADPFRPYGATVGHWLEWSRLAVHLRAGLGAAAPGWLLDHARSLFAAAVTQGWAVDGSDGFVYTVDWSGAPVVRQRMHWVAAEAVSAAAALHAATGESSYADWYDRWWRHVDDNFIDRVGGSWWHELSPDNRPSGQTWDGKPDLYHAVQATLIPRLPLSPTLAAALRDGSPAG